MIARSQARRAWHQRRKQMLLEQQIVTKHSENSFTFRFRRGLSLNRAQRRAVLDWRKFWSEYEG